jgi:hypothetical protein
MQKMIVLKLVAVSTTKASTTKENLGLEIYFESLFLLC